MSRQREIPRGNIRGLLQLGWRSPSDLSLRLSKEQRCSGSGIDCLLVDSQVEMQHKGSHLVIAFGSFLHLHISLV